MHPKETKWPAFITNFRLLTAKMVNNNYIHNVLLDSIHKEYQKFYIKLSFCGILYHSNNQNIWDLSCNWMIASFVTMKRQWYHNLFFFSNWTKIMTFISSTGWGKLTPTVSIILLWIIILKQISRNENLWGRCMCKPQNKSTHLHIGKTTAVIAWQLYKWGDLSAGFGVVGWSAGTPEM